MDVPSRCGCNRVPAVGTTTALALPEVEQGSAPFEGGGHRGGEALLEIQVPPGVVGIGPARDFGMARDRETVSRVETHGLALSRRAAYFPREHPATGTHGGKIAGLHPTNAFIGMPSFGPAPQRLKDRVIHRLKDFGADDLPVIQCPAPDERVQKVDQGPGSGALVSFDQATNLPQQGLDTLYRRLNEQLAVVFAEGLAEEVSTLLN